MDSAALSSICNGFGYREEDRDGTLLRYVKNEYCLDNLKDLQRLLRRDDPSGRAVFKQVCRWNVVARDLVPIIEGYQSDRNLVINTVKVLVFLTMPVDSTSEDVPQQVDYLWKLKGALARNATIAVIMSLLEDPLEHLESAAFTEDDWKMVQLLLTFFRNVLAIQDILPRQNTSGSSTQYLHLREQFLELLFNENVMDLILVLVEHINDSNGYLRQDNLLFLEIFHCIFQGHDPEFLVKASKRNTEVTEDFTSYVDSLRNIIHEEQEKSRIHRLKSLDRCLNFSGTFTSLNIDGNKTLVTGNPSCISSNPLFKTRQVHRGPLKRIPHDGRSWLLPNESLADMLSNFLNNFLTGGYNGLMQSICEDIENEHDAVQSGDVATFFWVACFVIAYQRYKFIDLKQKKVDSPTLDDSTVKNLNATSDGDICSPIAATLNEGMLLLVISRWREAFDSLKQTHDYKTLSIAGSLMKNMIRMLDLVLHALPDSSNESKTARILLYKLFYDQTNEGFTQFLLNQIKSFDQHRQAKSDLVDLVEILHVMLRLMESLQKHGSLRVSKKSRKRKKKPSKNTAHPGTAIGEPVSGMFTNDLVDESLPHNSELDIGLNEAVEDPTARVYHADADYSSLTPSEKPGMCPLDSDHPEKDSPKTDHEKTTHDLVYETDGFSDDVFEQETNEVDFNVSKLVAEFATSSAIQNLCWLLKFCKSNSSATNHYILCILQRICIDLELSPILYQLSFLVTFYDIMSDKKASKRCPEIVHFLSKLVRNMMKKMTHQPLLFVDILFPKTRKECHMINAEDLERELGFMKKEIEGICGEGTQQGFERLPRKSLAEALGEDEADLVFFEHKETTMAVSCDEDVEDLLDSSTAVGNENCLTTTSNDLGCGILNAEKNPGADLPQKGSTRWNKFVIDEKEELIIRSLYEKFKDERRCSRLIAEALDPQRKISPVQISHKLRQLGLKVAGKKPRADSNLSFKEGQGMSGSKSEVDNASCSQSIMEENGQLNSHRRKRIQAFSEDQEILIRNLFEQFKGKKQCSRMIANALDSNKYTVAQVSRKLRQLGLVLQKKKATKNGTSLHLEGLSEENSDEETLSKMFKRKRSKRRKILDKEAQKNYVDLSHHGNHPDAEPLNALPKDSNDLATPEKHEAADEMLAEASSLYEDLQDQMYEDDFEQQNEILRDSNLDFDSTPSSLELGLQKLNELADSGDDMDNMIAAKRKGMRRKLKIDMGFDDDDD